MPELEGAPRPAQPHAGVDAGVDKLVVDDDVPGLGHGGQEPRVGLVARVEEQASGRAVEAGQLALEGLGEGAVAVEEARAARAQAEALLPFLLLRPKEGEEGPPEVGGPGEGEVVVGREVDQAGFSRREGAQQASLLAPGELGEE